MRAGEHFIVVIALARRSDQWARLFKTNDFVS